MGDGVNIAPRLEGVAKPGAICLSEDAYRQVSGRLDMAVTDLGPTKLKNIDKSIRAYSLEVGKPAQAKPLKKALGRRHSLLVPLAIAIPALVIQATAPTRASAKKTTAVGPNGRDFKWQSFVEPDGCRTPRPAKGRRRYGVGDSQRSRCSGNDRSWQNACRACRQRQTSIQGHGANNDKRRRRMTGGAL